MTAEPLATRPQVLVVDDEWLLANFIEQLLQDAGYDVLGPASSVESALQIIADTVLTAAVLDVSLGNERSTPITQALERANIPFMLMTGYSRADLPEELKGHPLLMKPVDEQTLLDGLAALLRHAR